MQHVPQVTDVQLKDNNLYLKVWLIDDSINQLGFGIKRDYVGKHVNSVIGKPAILNQAHFHPLEFNDIQEETVTSPEVAKRNIAKYLEAQKRYEVFKVKSVEPIYPKDGLKQGGLDGLGAIGYNAYLEGTDDKIIQAYKNGTLRIPRYVSPSIYKINPEDKRDAIGDYEFLHIAFVDEPAYGTQVANVKGECLGTEQKCITQLAQASVFCPVKELENVKNVFVASINDKENSSYSSFHDKLKADTVLVDENNSNQQVISEPKPATGVIEPKTVEQKTVEVVNKQPVQQPVAVVEEKKEQVEIKTDNKDNEISELKNQVKEALNALKELKDYNDSQIKNSEEAKTKSKRDLIIKYVTKDTASNEEEWQKRIGTLMHIPDAELEDFLKVHYVVEETPCSKSKGLKQGGVNRAPRVTDFNEKPAIKAVEQAGIPEVETQAKRVLQFSRLISSSKLGGSI
jgi:hypothetical protein